MPNLDHQPVLKVHSLPYLCLALVVAKDSSTVNHSIQEWFIKERPKLGPLYEFHSVPWIERIEGIAYRKGVGRVVKNVWQ